MAPSSVRTGKHARIRGSAPSKGLKVSRALETAKESFQCSDC